MPGMTPSARNGAADGTSPPPVEDQAWLARFYAGDRQVIAEVYRDHGASLLAAVGALVSGVDRENVVHDVFASLLTSEQMRRGFVGGSLSAWLRQVARNRAIDLLRKSKRRKETDLDPAPDSIDPGASPAASTEHELAQRLVARLRADCVPEAWRPVFEARFVQQLSQRDAARSLGMRRTTLMYQETRIRALILKFLRRTDRGLFDG